MNNARRKELTELSSSISIALTVAETIRDDVQEYYDNMPESFQNGEKGEKAQEAINYLESLVSALEEAQSAIDDATSV